jgi:hypothetical protein
MSGQKFLTVFTMLIGLIFISSCVNGTSSTSTSTLNYSRYQLEYRILQNYPDVFWCDPDLFPVSREGQGQANAITQFADIKNKLSEFTAILEHLNFPNKTDYTDLEKLSIYKEHKLLTYAVSLSPSGNLYDFVILIGENQGKRIEGTITFSGQIQVTKEETSFNTCPICLTAGTLIDTPEGQLPIEQLQPGMMVWTQNDSHRLSAVQVIKTASTAVPAGFLVIRIVLADGRNLAASPGHPTTSLIPLGNYKIGDNLDGSTIVKLGIENYDEGYTWDILPAGPTGFYIANGIWLKSTLAR